jgi:hypothetical protein
MMGTEPWSVAVAVMMPLLVLSWTAVEEDPHFAGFEPPFVQHSMGVDPSEDEDPGAPLWGRQEVGVEPRTDSNILPPPPPPTFIILPQSSHSF